MRYGKQNRITLVTQLLCILLLLALLAAMLITEGLRAADTVLREQATVRSYTYTDALFGYVFRDETALESSNNGPIAYTVASGATVADGDVVARVFVDDTDTDKRERAAALYRELDALQAALAAAPNAWQADYVADYRTLMLHLGKGQLPRAIENADHIAALLSGRDAANADTAAALQQRIDALQAELNGLVQYVDKPQSVPTGTAGVFYREVDGYEALFGTQTVDGLTPTALDALLGDSQSTAAGIGKVAQMGTWYLAVPVRPELAAAYVVGRVYTVHFDESDLTLPLTLEQINPDPDNTRALLVLRADSLPDGFGAARRRTVHIERESVSGLCIPADALCEGNTVYVDADGVARLRYVTPILQEDGCLLLAPATGEAGYLQEGERVLLSVRRIYDGKVLK